jgi:hypothetical protein
MDAALSRQKVWVRVPPALPMVEPLEPWPRMRAEHKIAQKMDATWWRRMRIKTGALREDECEYVELHPVIERLISLMSKLT